MADIDLDQVESSFTAFFGEDTPDETVTASPEAEAQEGSGQQETPQEEAPTETQETQPQAEEIPFPPELQIPEKEAPDDQIARTRMGRRLKMLEENMATKEDIEEIKTLLARFAVGNSKTDVDNFLPYGDNYEYEAPEEEKPITKKDLPIILKEQREREAKEAQEAKQNYTKDYIGRLKTLMVNPEFKDIWADIVPLITNEKDLTFNVNYSEGKDPIGDAEKNVSRAAMHILRQRIKPPATNQFQDRPKTQTATAVGGSPTTTTPPQKERIKLDPRAEAFIRALKISDDEVEQYVKP